jgi:methylenetetrahydrofolate reductase (NADPH)
MTSLLNELADAKIENVLALRGDLPVAAPESHVPATRDFRYASDLVSFIRSQDYTFCLGSAAYPEGHMECASREADLQHLKIKVDAGLDFLITQLFFDNAFYFDFVERARRVGINVPIVPGIMPITSYEQLNRFIRLCGATVPMRLAVQLEQVKDDPEAIVQLGVAHATLQCLELLQRGVPGIHFYTLNRSPATRMIVSALRARFAS